MALPILQFSVPVTLYIAFDVVSLFLTDHFSVPTHYKTQNGEQRLWVRGRDKGVIGSTSEINKQTKRDEILSGAA